MEACASTGTTFTPEPGKTIEDYLKFVATQMDRE